MTKWTYDRMDGFLRNVEVRRLPWGWWINGAWCPTRVAAQRRLDWFRQAPRELLREGERVEKNAS